MPRVMRRSNDRGYTQDYSRIQRIRIPQSPDRPLRLRKRDVLRTNYLRFNPWWWISHRRGITGRPKVGIDPLEARAVSRDMVLGTLPERIVYQWLLAHYFTPGIDYDFQSSLEGGRLELGGVVVDFLFPILRIAIQVQGPTHEQAIRMRKDEEQRMILESDGYQVIYLEMDLIYNEARFEDEMRRIFNYGYLNGGGGGVYTSAAYEEDEDLQRMQIRLSAISNLLGM